MSAPRLFRFVDTSTEWYEDILTNHAEEASAKVIELLDSTLSDENGCRVTATEAPRKLRFRGGQDRAYRFVYCVSNRVALDRHQVVRHRCHNRRCVNPAHLIIGDRRDNLEDERERQANGVDFRLL